MKNQLIALLAAVLGLLALSGPANAAAITVDGTALGASYRLLGPGGTTSFAGGVRNFTRPDSSTQTFQNAAGQSFSFDIDGSGNISIAAPATSFASVTGGATLTISGFGVTINPGILTGGYRILSTNLGGFAGGIRNLQIIPGNYTFQPFAGLTAWPFSVDNSGNVQIGAGYIPIPFDASSVGTTVLNINTYLITVDPNGLSSAYRILPSVLGFASGVRTFNGLPGNYNFQAFAGLTQYPFTVDTAGLLQFSPTLSPTPFDGSSAGTTTLRLTSPSTVYVDPGSLTGAYRILPSVLGFGGGIRSFPALAGNYTFQAYAGMTQYAFSIDASGNVSYSASIPFFGGAGTDTLSITPLPPFSVDATAITGTWRVLNGMTAIVGPSVQTFNPLPGDYTFDRVSGVPPPGPPDQFSFSIDDDGNAVFAAAQNYLYGAGTSTLIVCAGECCVACEDIAQALCELTILSATAPSILQEAVETAMIAAMDGVLVCEGQQACLDSVLAQLGP